MGHPALWLFALLGWTLLFTTYDLDGGAGFATTDCWVAQTAREMYAGRAFRDFVVPTFSGETRMQKSPGPYWAVMLAAAIRGQDAIDAVAARLPNVVAALAIVATVFWLTRRIAGDRPAVFAGFACASSVLILYWSHRAASDLGLAALTTVALAMLWAALAHPGRGRPLAPATDARRALGGRLDLRATLWVLGGFAAGLGMLYKLPMPVVLVGLPLVLYVAIQRRWTAIPLRLHLLGGLAFLLPWLPWAIAALWLEPTALAKWRVEFIDRFTGALPNVQGQRALGFHLLYVLPPILYCLPYSLSLPAALWRVVRPPPEVDRRGLHFLGLWFVSHFVFFTASAGKEVRYFLPALPPLFVLLGIELSRFFDSRGEDAQPLRTRLGTWAATLLVPAGFVGATFAVYQWYRRIGRLEGFEWSQVWIPYAVTGLLFCTGCITAAQLHARRRREASFAALVLTMWVTWLWIWPRLMPVFESQRPFQDFAAQLRTHVDPSLRPHLRQVGSQDPRIVWYSDIRFPRIVDQLELLRRQGGRRSLEREIELVGEAMVDALEGSEPVLLVAARADYVRFLVEAPRRLAARGRTMPPVHLWLQTRLGPKSRHFVLLGNRPPPWPEPPLTPPSDRLANSPAWQGGAAARVEPSRDHQRAVVAGARHEDHRKYPD